MVGGFAPGVLIAGIGPLVGLMGIVENLIAADNFNRMAHHPVRQTTDASRHQQFFTGRQNPAADWRVINGPQGDGQQLVGSQGIIGDSLASRLSGRRMQAVREKPQIIIPEQI